MAIKNTINLLANLNHKPNYYFMKSSLALLAVIVLFALSCNKSGTTENNLSEETLAPTERQCASYEVLQQQMNEDPSLRQRMEEIEEFTRRFQENPDASRLLASGVMEVPVVVNVLWKTAAENISDEQIQSQIDVLNEDFSATNSDYNLTSTYNSVKSGNCNIRFVLQAVVRKQTNKKSWQANDGMKKSQQGGIDPTSPLTTLNIWVCTLGGNLLGYAQFPGGNPATDGVVCLNTAFGRVGSVEAPFHKGRTTTHEVGHYFNLRHIWGDATCGNDFVSDTPLHNTYNFGCPPANHLSTCTGTPVEMTMNYMDYSDDPCMYMFTAGQKTRMQATYVVGGPRASLR
jgi:hypothetical protein